MNAATLLGAEGLDEDYFAPPPGGTLANIFGTKPSNLPEENSSLKYVPPKPQNFIKSKEELPPENVDQTQAGLVQKTSECLIARAVFAHELVNSSYEPRGKLGFAILKILDPIHYKIVLYNSEKKTLSSATATGSFQVTVHNNNYITYYDDAIKNWSLLFSNSQELSAVMSEFNKCGINISQQGNETAAAEQTTQLDRQSQETAPSKVVNIDRNESSDEGKLDRQAKISLLNRISMMGVPMIYPKPPLSTDRTSDSSDTNEESCRPKDKPLPTRHKGPKTLSIARKIGNKNLELSDSSIQDFERENPMTSVVPLAQQTNISRSSPLFTYINGQLVPISKNDEQSNLNVFLSETRASNSEIRININRLTDKVDQVLDKIKLVDNVRQNETIERTQSLTTDIFQKLLHEYEDKIRLKEAHIKTLEEKLNTSGKNMRPDDSVKNEDFEQKYEELLRTQEIIMSENTYLNNELEELKNLLSQIKNELEISKENRIQAQNEIDNLQKNIKIIDSDKLKIAEKNIILKSEIEDIKSKNSEINILYLKACEDLEKFKSEHSENLQEIASEAKNHVQNINPDMESKIKSIMNSTFRGLAANFESGQTYSGDEIRSVVASVIKHTTLEALIPQKHS